MFLASSGAFTKSFQQSSNPDLHLHFLLTKEGRARFTIRSGHAFYVPYCLGSLLALGLLVRISIKV